MSTDKELLLLSRDSTKRCHWLQQFGLMNIFEHVWKPAIIASKNCSALHAINCTCNHGFMSTRLLLNMCVHRSLSSASVSSLHRAGSGEKCALNSIKIEEKCCIYTYVLFDLLLILNNICVCSVLNVAWVSTDLHFDRNVWRSKSGHWRTWKRWHYT